MPLRERRRLPKPIADVIDRSLQAEPNDRYPNAGVMRKALKNAAAACRAHSR